jgi:hypothetical protein
LAHPLLFLLIAVRPIQYDDLAPFSNVVDFQAIWKTLHLPKLPATFCHVGLLGWHCHNGSMLPWNPQSLIPKDQMPPMPANVSCVICPQGWKGVRKSVLDVLLDFPIVQATGRLPAGSYYDMQELKAAAKVVAAASGSGAKQQGPHKTTAVLNYHGNSPDRG